MELKGTEVKSIRAGKVNIADSFARVENGQMLLYGCDIQPWETAGEFFQHQSRRPRRLLLHKREIFKLEQQTSQKGCSLVALKLYWKNGKVKLALGLGKGKTHRDQRYDLKARVEMREAQREVARINRRKPGGNSMVAVRFLPEAFLRPSHSLITGICPGINGNAAKGETRPTSAPGKNRLQLAGHACRKSYNFQSTGNSTWPPFLSS
ncbi:MAG: SsrA-binding protein SmpB [Akkermansia sp.]